MEASAEKEHLFARALMDDLPATVRIGPYDFRIERWSHHQASGNSRYGEFSSIEQTIRFQFDMPSRYKAVDTLFHEICHAFYWACGASDDDKEERLVGMLATAITALHRDNPWLTSWIDKAEL